MEIDKQTIKALSSDSRIEILKMLSEKRRIPADISKNLRLNSSTIAEHLHRLESAGLVRKNNTGHKWIYYEITEKGANLVKPKVTMQLVFVLSIGLIMVFFGVANLLDAYKLSWAASSTSAISDFGVPREAPLPIPYANMAIYWISITITAAGIILAVLSLYKLLRRKYAY